MEIQLHVTSPLPGKKLTHNSDLLPIQTGSQLRYLMVFQIILTYESRVNVNV